MQWWGALTNQFAELATNAMKDSAADAAKALAGGLDEAVVRRRRQTMKKVAGAPGRAVAGAAKSLAPKAPQAQDAGATKAAKRAKPRAQASPRSARRDLMRASRHPMNAPLPETAAALAAERGRRQAEVVAALGRVLPAHALLWRREDTVPYECDGLTAYREQPLVVALPETERQVADVLARLPSPRGAGGRARRRHGPVGRRAAAIRSASRSASPSSTASSRIDPHGADGDGAERRAQPRDQRGGSAASASSTRPTRAARSPARSAATSPRTRAACIA